MKLQKRYHEIPLKVLNYAQMSLLGFSRNHYFHFEHAIKCSILHLLDSLAEIYTFIFVSNRLYMTT